MNQGVMENVPNKTASVTDDPEPHALPLGTSALLLDIDGTLLDLAPSPHEVYVPPKLASSLSRLLARTAGALALVSGRSLSDIDRIFAPMLFPAVGGHGAEMRISIESEAVAAHAPPMNPDLIQRFAAIAELHPGILVENKGYSLALHFRKAPDVERAIYDRGIGNTRRPAERAHRGAAGQVRLRDQAFGIYQGDRRDRTDVA